MVFLQGTSALEANQNQNQDPEKFISHIPTKIGDDLGQFGMESEVHHFIPSPLIIITSLEVTTWQGAGEIRVSRGVSEGRADGIPRDSSRSEPGSD